MPSQWLAVGAGVDSRARARQLRQSWERLLAGRELASESPPAAAAGMRQAIVDSWRRSLDTGLDPVDLLAPVEADSAEIHERWTEHPFGSLAHVLVDQLGAIADESQSLIVVSDASGLLLHIEGPRATAQSPLRNRLAAVRRTSFAASTPAAPGLHQPRRLSPRKNMRASKPGNASPCGMAAVMDSP